MPKRRCRNLRPLTLVWLAPESVKRRYPFLKDMPLVFLGELRNMRGYCALAGTKSGRVYAPYETALFAEVEMRPVK